MEDGITSQRAIRLGAIEGVWRRIPGTVAEHGHAPQGGRPRIGFQVRGKRRGIHLSECMGPKHEVERPGRERRILVRAAERATYLRDLDVIVAMLDVSQEVDLAGP